MIHRIGRKKFKIFALDIESHNDAESVEMRKTSMWLGCFIDETSQKEDESSYFYNMDELFDRLEDLCSKRQKHREKNSLCIKPIIL